MNPGKHTNNQLFIRHAQFGLSVSLLFYAFVCPISHSLTYFSIVFITILTGYIWLKEEGSSPLKYSIKTLVIIWVLLAVWQIVTLLINSKEVTFSPILKAFNILPVFLLAGLPCDNNWKKDTARHALFTLLIVTSLVVILGLIQKASGIIYPLPKQPFHDGMLFGFFGYYIYMGGFCSTLAVFTLSLILFWRASPNTKIGVSCLFFILVAGTLFSMSRTYYISLLVTIVFLLVKKSWKATAIGLLCIIMISLITFTLSPSIRDRAFSISDVKNHPSNVERIYLLKIAIDIIHDYPVAGVGFKQWGNAASSYKERYTENWTFTPAYRAHAHNEYLNIAAETGLIGLFLFVFFWFYLFYVLLKQAKKHAGDSFIKAVSLGASFALVNMLLGGLFEENFGKLPNIFSIAFLISLALFLDKEKKEGPSEIA